MIPPDDLELTTVAWGTRLRLRVKPSSRRNAIVGSHGGALKLSVVAPPERGRANRAVSELLATALGLPPSRVTIVAGETSQDKIAEIALDPTTVRAILATLEPGRKR